MATARVAPVATPPEDIILPDVNIAVFDSKVYSIQAVDLPVQDVIKQIKAFYQDNLDRIKESIIEEPYQKAQEDWSQQLSHLERVSQINNALIPPALYGKLVMYYGNSVCEARYITYRPNKITSDAYRLKSIVVHNRSDRTRVARTGLTKIFEAVKDLSDDSRVSIVIDQNKIMFETLFIYSKLRNLIYTPHMRGFHTMSGKDLCTGDTSAGVFWANQEFSSLVNTINLFSLAQDSVYVDGIETGEADDRVNYAEFLKDQYVVSVEREGLWRV